MAHRIQSGKGMKNRRQFGFTLIELMIVMAIIITLMGVAVPFYQKSITRAKETVLKNNLFAMRSAIDEYSYDKQKAPQTLNDLVTGLPRALILASSLRACRYVLTFNLMFLSLIPIYIACY